MTNRHKLTVATACAIAVLGAAALNAAPARDPSTYMYTLMVNVVGPPANSLWQVTAKEPMNDQDWIRVKQLAEQLSHAATAVAIGGNSLHESQRAKSAEWKHWAGKFADAVSAAVRSAEQNQRAGLLAASESLLEACEGCHIAFPPTPIQ